MFGSKFYFVFAPVLIMICTNLCSNGAREPSPPSDDSKTRQKRKIGKYLIFPEGSNVQLVYCLTISTYTSPVPIGGFSIGVTAALAYQLPYQASLPYGKSAAAYHRRSRRDLYHKIESLLGSHGKDGRGCVLKALCKAGQQQRTRGNAKSTFEEELLHSIFTFSNSPGDSRDMDERKNEYDDAHNAAGNCDRLFPSCPQLF